MPTECERSATSSVTTKISSSNEIKDNNSTITTTSSSINFNEDLQTSTTSTTITMMEGGDMSTSQTSTTSNGSSSCNGGGRKTSITSPDPTAYVAKARVTRPTPPPPPYNPMQFVQIKPCNLYQTAQEQLKKAEEVKKIKEIRKEEPEDWQNNLDNWKSSRRKRVEHIIDRVVEVKKLELEEHDRTRRKSKTFSEMIEERGERAGGRGLNKLVSLAVYAEDESNDLSDLGIGTSSASGKSSLSEDYDNNSVMSDNAAELDKAITNSTHHKPATDSTTREYISSPGYETSSSTAPASSPDPCEYTYEGAIQDYKQRVSRAASGLTAVALNKLTQHNQTQQNSKESTPERGVVKETATTTAAYPPRRGSKIEDRLMGFEVQSPSSEECVEKSKVDVPKIDISKRKEIFEQQQQLQQQQQQQALQTNEPKSSQLLGHQTNTTVVVPRVTLRDRFKDTRTEKSVTEQPKKELKRLSGDITSIKERLQSLEQQQNLVNGGANGAIKATANKLVDIPVPPLKERLSSLQNAVTKEEIRKPPVVLVDARQLEIMKVEEEKAQQSLKETKEKVKEKEKQPQSETVITTAEQLQKQTNKIVTDEPEETDRDDSGIHTADDVELDEQQQQRLQADQMMKKEQELKLNAAIEALAKEEQQLSEAANVVNQIEAEFEELTLASVATLPPLAGTTAANTTAASSSSASASATPITNDHMEYSINEALELALAAIDKETIPVTTAVTQQQAPPPPPQQLQPQPENLYPITAPSSNTFDNNNSSSSSSNNLNNICNNNNNKNHNNNNKQVVPPTEDILLNKTDEEKYEKLNLDIKLEEKSEEEISQEPIYENINTTTNNSTASINDVDVALMMSTTTKTTTETETSAKTVAYQQQQQPQIIPSMIMMMHNTTDDHNNTDQQYNNNNNKNNNDNDVRIDNDNKSSLNHKNNNHNNHIIKPLQIENSNQNSNQNVSTLTNAASATATVNVTTTALASKQLKNIQINKINNNNNNNNNNINNIVVANDNNYNHHNHHNNKQNLNDLTNAFANTTITTTSTKTTTNNNAITTLENISTTTTVNHKPNNNNNTNTNSCSTTTTKLTTTSSSSSTIHLKELNFNQQTPLMMTTAAVQQQQQSSDLNKSEQHLQQQQQQQHLNDDNNSEPYYQVPKSNEPYYDAPKHLKPIPVYENIEVFFNGNSLSSTDLNSHLQPPKEKPPPPPVDSPPLFDDIDSSSHTDTWSSDNTYETLTRHQNNHNHNNHSHQHLSADQPSPPIKRMNSTKRIKKELRHKRSSFLGIEGSSLDDDESYLELTVAPPPDMAQLLQEERRLEKQLYLKAGLCDSSDTGESRDSGVSENHSRQSSEHYTNSSEENEPHDDTTSPLTLQTQTDTQPNDMIYQNDGLLAVVPTPLLQTVKGNSAESWTESATVAAAATQSLTEATATANAKMMSIEEKIREQEEVLRVERELLQLEQEELKRQRENLMLRENMARRELQHGAKMLMSANRRSLQDLNGLGAMTVVDIQNESQIPANGLEMYHHQMHPGLQAAQGQQHMMSNQPQLAQPQQLQQQANKSQQIYANIPNLQQQYYHMETDYRKSMSDINEFSKRMMSQPPAPPSKPMRAMHTNTTSNANGGVIHNVEQNDYAARQRHSLNTQNFGGSLVKIAAAPTAAPRTAAHIYSNYQHQSVQNLAPTSTGQQHQQVLTTANQSLYPGNMSRNTLHALSATPKPKYTDGWVQVQQRKSYDSNLANDPAWLSAYQQKRKSMPDANYHGYNPNNHWLIQEAEQRRLNEQQQQQQQQQRRTISSNNMPLHQMTNGSSTVLSTATTMATATTNGKPLPDSIIQTLTERVQSKGIGERKRTNLDKSPLHAASTYHHYQQQQQQQQQYNKLNQTQQQFSSNTAIHRHNNIITTLSSTVTASTATSSMAATAANGQSNITTITQQQQQQQQHQQLQQQQQDKVLSVSGKKKCSHCGDELGRGAAMIIESLLLFYHINCFKCCVCHVQLGDGLNGTDVRVRNHKLHCQNCYSSDDGIKFSCV